MGLAVSRLARNTTDWHRLLEICALSETLILDEDGIYDPGHFNDRCLACQRECWVSGFFTDSDMRRDCKWMNVM
jgi:hypothetical protein